MLEMDLRLDAKVTRYAAKRLKDIEGGMPKAAERAINRTLTRGKTRWSQSVTGEFRVKKGDAAGSMRIDRALAKRRKLYGQVYATGNQFELVKFVGGRPKPWSSYQRVPKVGAQIQVRRSGSKVRVAGAFVERGTKTGKLHVMWRVREGGKVAAREARILYGPSARQMADAALPRVGKEMRRYFRRRFVHEVREIVRRGKVVGYGGR